MTDTTNTSQEQALRRRSSYAIDNTAAVLTPALVLYEEVIEANMQATLAMLGGDPARWRPHVKTAKLQYVMEMLVRQGVTHMKCATVRELEVACRAGATDVLVAYASMGANAQQVDRIAQQFPSVRVSVLVETVEQAAQWHGGSVSLFIDIDSGMHRTGISLEDTAKVLTLAQHISGSGLIFRGLHFYDGHLLQSDLRDRTQSAHEGYRQLLNLCSELEEHGLSVEELVIGGTPTLPCVVSCVELQKSAITIRVSPGTVVYSDLRTLRALPRQVGLQPAALVLTRVGSHPTEDKFTCNAGHKSLSVDAGFPHGEVVGQPEYQLLQPSEEHLPLRVPAGVASPQIGELLYLIPAHVCTTVHNFDEALLVRDGRVQRRVPIEARGRGALLLDSTYSNCAERKIP